MYGEVELDVSKEFTDYCNKAGFFCSRNRKQRMLPERLSGTAEVNLKVKDGNIGCKICFGKGISNEIVKGLFSVMPRMGKLYALELVNVPFLTAEIGELSLLRQFIVDSKEVESIPKEIAKLKNLTELTLRIEKLQKIPEWVMDLENLEILDLVGTGINEIPKNINQLKKLKVLDLSCTRLKRIPATILDLGLQVRDHFNEDDTPGIYFCDAECQEPSTEIVVGGTKRLEIYYNNNKPVAQNVVRVILLGIKGSGKTSIVQRLKELEDGNKYYTGGNVWTEGISINELKCKNGGLLNIWDFGGQEIMLSTHTLFLRDHCIYIIVLNARQGDEPERWLDYISQYGRNSSVFIINNHMDGADPNKLDMNRLRRLYPNLIKADSKAWNISCEKPEEFPLDGFYKQLLNVASKYFNEKIPLSWSHINNELMDMQKSGKSVNYLTHKEYVDACKRHGIVKNDERHEVLNWLNEIGTVFSYGNPRKIDTANEFKVIRPAWVTDAIYKIINNADMQQAACVISHDKIREALLWGKNENNTVNEYTDVEIGFILGIMRKFYLSFHFSEILEFIPAIAQNEEFSEVMDWVTVHENIDLDIVYKLLQKNRDRRVDSSFNFTLFYQVIVKMVEQFNVFPRMWRSGAIFEHIYGMQILIFLQDRGKWDSEMRMMIKKEERSDVPEACIHQYVMTSLKKFAEDYIIDPYILISNEEKHYFSLTMASKQLLNKSDTLYYDSVLDKKIDLYEDVLKKITLTSDELVLKEISQLRKEINSGNQQTEEALYLLNQLLEKSSSVNMIVLECTRILQNIEARGEDWINLYADIFYDSVELKKQLQQILEICNFQKDDMSTIKELVRVLSEPYSHNSNIIETLKKVINSLATGVTLVTADYSKVKCLLDTIYILIRNIDTLFVR